MLTRLQVTGFKNLIDLDIHFGPLTCFAGCNGVGKSNIFDAICFLGNLARKSLLDAAFSIRGEKPRSGDIRHIFYHHKSNFIPEMSLIADMLISPSAIDDLGQEAMATYTYLRYTLKLRYRKEDKSDKSLSPIEIAFEELTYLRKGDYKDLIKFSRSPEWDESVLIGKKASKFISTEENSGKAVIKLHQDNKRGGNPKPFLAETMPRTVLSTGNAAECPTVLCARREMESWVLLQLEPSALRRSDDYTAPAIFANNGEHLPAVLHRLAAKNPTRILQQVSNSLTELIDDVRGVRVDEDEKRQLYTVFVKDKSGTEHPAHALSDGALRFLALSVMSMDPSANGLVCLEEPENGIHPERITAMLALLKDMTVDTMVTVDETNTLRQVIINTHSPAFVAEMPENSLLMVQRREIKHNDELVQGLVVSAMSNTWYAKVKDIRLTTKKQLLSYLQPFSFKRKNSIVEGENDFRRIIDRPEAEQMCIQFPMVAEGPERYGE
jgi:predicted ATPase